MATIASLLRASLPVRHTPHQLLPLATGLGFELELEGRDDWGNLSGWRSESDGSLRDGIEYVFDGPAGGAEAIRRIEAMADYLGENPPHNSFRCSTHIHMDVRDMEPAELERLVLAYTMFESVMFDHCAPERRYSNFCAPFFVNTGLAGLFGRLFHNVESEGLKLSGMNHWPKYSALNLKPILQYGSVEFRGSHALTTREDMLALAQRMLHLKRVALENNLPFIQFVERLRSMQVSDVFQSGLSEGYSINEKQFDKGYSSALFIASGVSSSVLQSERGTSRPSIPPRAARPRDERDPWVVPNSETMERYNLFPSERMRMSSVINMVKVLRQAQGIGRRPDFRDFVDYRDYVGGGVMVDLFTQAGIRATYETALGRL